MKVVIIAGGRGTRIASIANEIPKAMIPVAGKPVVEYQIELARRYGFKEIIFVLGYLGEDIKHYFGDGGQWGVHIEYYQEQKPLGTSGALPYLRDRLSEDFWVFYGDTVMDFDMSRMLSFHKIHGAISTLFLHPNDHPYDSDLAEVTDDGIVSTFHPKPHKEGSVYHNLVNAALYILKSRAIDYIPLDQKSDFGSNIFPSMLTSGELIAGYVSPEYIKDMGTPERWAKVGLDIDSGKVARLNMSNSRSAIFLDRDGVICREVDLLNMPEQIELIEGSADAVKIINNSGYLAVLVTNQPVIARNLCSLEELDKIHKKLETLLGLNHAYLDAIYFCPHHPHSGYPEERKEYKIECECRKPKPGMLLRAAKELNIDLTKSFMIGDRELDLLAGNAAGVKTSFQITQNEPNALLVKIKEILE